MKSLHFTPDWSAATTEFKHTWAGLDNLDQFRWLVRRDVQELLQTAYNELGTRHVRAVGMFDDELRVLGNDPKDMQRKPRYNWQLIDYCIDSLLDIGINPMITTSFMPSVLASKESPCFNTGANTSPPNDWNAWADLVQKTVEHFAWRYGKARMREWYFEVWNEPNLVPPFFSGTQEDYFHLYKVTHDAIKSVDADFKVGGPSTARCAWVADFINWTRANNCEADYIIGHIYNNDGEHGALSPFTDPAEQETNASPHFSDRVIRECRMVMDSLDFKGELQWNEWGRSWWPEDKLREAGGEAAYIVKAMTAISQDVDQLAHWCISDIYDQGGYLAKAFDGYYGMSNLQGLRKPSWKAYQLLNRLGTERIPVIGEDQGESKNNGILVTKTENGFKFMVYLYDENQEPDLQDVAITLDLPEGKQVKQTTVYRIDDVENNILHNYRELGSPEYLSRDETAALHAVNGLVTSEKNATIEGNQLKLSVQNSSTALVEVEW